MFGPLANVKDPLRGCFLREKPIQDWLLSPKIMFKEINQFSAHTPHPKNPTPPGFSVITICPPQRSPLPSSRGARSSRNKSSAESTREWPQEPGLWSPAKKQKAQGRRGSGNPSMGFNFFDGLFPWDFFHGIFASSTPCARCISEFMMCKNKVPKIHTNGYQSKELFLLKYGCFQK